LIVSATTSDQKGRAEVEVSAPPRLVGHTGGQDALLQHLPRVPVWDIDPRKNSACFIAEYLHCFWRPITGLT
jgi:hypothetical protein